MRRPRHPLRLAFGALAAVVLLSAYTAFAAANTVPPSGADLVTTPVVADNLIPIDCQSFHMDNVITGSGVIIGTNASDLIYGGSFGDSIIGLNQKDCILGGGGSDIIFGGNSEDVLVGGTGGDTLDGGNGSDICYGGPGIDLFISCETAYP